ncbi:HAD family hydrolase [Thioalkalivibrio sp. HK1]|uniref:HAD family hydrolase n=1 Tax=Thioalkalivibrio sp. HK1 TaxID=1469245 RepID=UPI00046EDC47|nr:HAD family hydrolase [Thioalkalivibrio sp. HK1]
MNTLPADAGVSKRLLVTDLDGTLLDSDARLGDANRKVLESADRARTVRMVATGRSLHSASKVMDSKFPVDYLAFSSGAGIVAWPSGELLFTCEMDSDLADRLIQRLVSLSVDFTVHHAPPETHRCYVHRASRSIPNVDFEDRLARYAGFFDDLSQATPSVRSDAGVGQLLAIEPPGMGSCLDTIAQEFPEVNVVRTTSPLDHASTWVEIFPLGTSKSRASEWVRRRHGIDPAATFAIGNDYNDLDMLEWARHAFVVENAPESMRERFETVASNNEAGFAEAVRRWKTRCPPDSA